MTNPPSERDAQKSELLQLTRGPLLMSMLVCVGVLVISHLFQVILIVFGLMVVGSAIGLVTKPERYPSLRRFVFAKSRGRSGPMP
jgi:hypothetical protein